MKYIICKGCGEKIDSPDKMGYYQRGIMEENLSRESNHQFLTYEFGEFEADDGGIWYCKNCDEDLGLDFEEGEEYYLNLLNEEEITKEFLVRGMNKREAVIKRIEEMDEDDFWNWVRSWLDPQIIIDMIKDWSEDAIADEYEYLGLFMEI